MPTYTRTGRPVLGLALLGLDGRAWARLRLVSVVMSRWAISQTGGCRSSMGGRMPTSTRTGSPVLGLALLGLDGRAWARLRLVLLVMSRWAISQTGGCKS